MLYALIILVVLLSIAGFVAYDTISDKLNHLHAHLLVVQADTNVAVLQLNQLSQDLWAVPDVTPVGTKDFEKHTSQAMHIVRGEN